MLCPQLIQLPIILLEAVSTVLVFVLLPMAIVVLLCFIPSIVELKRPLDSGPKLIHPTFTAGFIAKGLIGSASKQSPLPLKPAQNFSSLFPAFLLNLEEL